MGTWHLLSPGGSVICLNVLLGVGWVDGPRTELPQHFLDAPHLLSLHSGCCQDREGAVCCYCAGCTITCACREELALRCTALLTPARLLPVRGLALITLQNEYKLLVNKVRAIPLRYEVCR